MEYDLLIKEAVDIAFRFLKYDKDILYYYWNGEYCIIVTNEFDNLKHHKQICLEYYELIEIILNKFKAKNNNKYINDDYRRLVILNNALM